MDNSKKAMQFLGRIIKEQRSGMQLSQTDLANLAGLSLNFVSQIEAGKTTAQIGKVIEILHALGMCFSLEYGKNCIISRIPEAEK
ncbi:MAG: helix-turn-helix domain-containing protein [Candidatus Ozemobacteraceae bacterium]